jgi:hypothetical protein
VSDTLVLGPQDPEATSELTKRLGVHNKAGKLLERHRRNYPEGMTTILAYPRDDLRSESLDLEELEDELRGLRGRKAFFEEDDELVHANVRGSKATGYFVDVLYRKPSGRTARGVISYEPLSGSVRAFEAAQAAEEAGGARVVVGGDEELQAALESAEKEKRDAQSALQEMQDRISRLENPEPWDGYDETSAQEKVDLIKQGGLEEYGKAGLERIRDYERSRGNDAHKSVLTAVDGILNGE